MSPTDVAKQLELKYRSSLIDSLEYQLHSKRRFTPIDTILGLHMILKGHVEQIDRQKSSAEAPIESVASKETPEKKKCPQTRKASSTTRSRR